MKAIFDSNKIGLAFMVLVKIFIYGATHLVAEANGKKVAEIYWNSSNPIFHFDNEKHKIEVRIRDSIDIICPKYIAGFPEERMEYSLIYLVDRQSYEKCEIPDSSKTKLVGICAKPFSDQIITLVFRIFTPSPNGLEFKPGEIYYAISTSDGSKKGMNNINGGLCQDYNMRLQFIVKHRRWTPSMENSHQIHTAPNPLGVGGSGSGSIQKLNDYEISNEIPNDGPAQLPPMYNFPRAPQPPQLPSDRYRPPYARERDVWSSDRRPPGSSKNEASAAAISNTKIRFTMIIIGILAVIFRDIRFRMNE